MSSKAVKPKEHSVDDKTNVKKEGLFERLDALLIGLLLAVPTLVATNTYWGAVVDQTQFPLLLTYTVSLPVTAVVGYLLMVHVLGPIYLTHWHPEARKINPLSPQSPEMVKREAFLKMLLRWWNLMLAFTSLVMLLGLGVPLIMFWYENGFNDFLCRDGGRWRQSPSLWIFIFALTKYLELVDTVFLILRNKPVPFLHWYHHFTVLLYTWFANAHQFTPGWTFGTVNCFVHTVSIRWVTV